MVSCAEIDQIEDYPDFYERAMAQKVVLMNANVFEPGDRVNLRFVTVKGEFLNCNYRHTYLRLIMLRRIYTQGFMHFMHTVIYAHM